MNEITVNAFEDELEKIAASFMRKQRLQASVRRKLKAGVRREDMDPGFVSAYKRAFQKEERRRARVGRRSGAPDPALDPRIQSVGKVSPFRPQSNAAPVKMQALAQGLKSSKPKK
jgi:hypothetical protein